MSENIETQIKALREALEKQNMGNNINITSGEGGGKSSCLIKSSKNGKSYEIKVYSNDILGAPVAVSEAIANSKTLDQEINGDKDGQ